MGKEINWTKVRRSCKGKSTEYKQLIAKNLNISFAELTQKYLEELKWKTMNWKS